MARTKHFPTLNEYAAWVVKQPSEAVLGTAFDGVSRPYENYLSEYYGAKVVVIAGDCCEMHNRRYELPAEWAGITVCYHDSDLYEAYEEAGCPQSGIEVTTEIELTYLCELLGSDVVKMPACKKARKPTHEVHPIARLTFKATGAVLYGIKSTVLKTGVESIYHVTVLAGKVRGCQNAATGEDCEGRHFTGHCCHGDCVTRLEDGRTDIQATTSTHIIATRRYTHEYIAVCQCDACRAEKSRRDAEEAPERARKAAIKAEVAARKRAAFDDVVAQVAEIERRHANKQIHEAA